MAFIARTRPGRGLCLLAAGGVLLMALTAATATAAPPTPMEGSAPEPPRLGTTASATPSSRTGASTRPRTPIPGFLLDRAATPSSTHRTRSSGPSRSALTTAG